MLVAGTGESSLFNPTEVALTITSCGMLASDSSGPAPCAPSSRASDSALPTLRFRHGHHGTAFDQSKDDRARGAASTEDDGAGTGQRALPLQRANRADPIGVGGDEPIPVEQHGVGGADSRGGGVHRIDELQDARLVRDRNRDLAKAEPSDPGDRVSQATGRDVERQVESIEP